MGTKMAVSFANIFMAKIETNSHHSTIKFTADISDTETVFLDTVIQLFRQRLSHKSVKAYATMPIGIMGRKSLALID